MTNMDELPPDQQTPVAVPPSAKLIIAVVYIMSGLLVLMFLALVGGVIWKIVNKTPKEIAGPPPVIDLALPVDARVEAIALDGDKLAVNTGSEIIVIDIRKNAVVARIAVKPK
jgi:hypothetical protein